MSIILGTLLPLALLVFTVVPAISQLHGLTHPRRLLAEGLSSGFLLVIASLMLGAQAWSAILWWAALALVVIAQAVSMVRLLRAADGPAAEEGTMTEGSSTEGSATARAASDGTSTEGAASEGAERTGIARGAEGTDAAADPGPGRTREQPPGLSVLVINGVLWAAVTLGALLAG